MVDIFAESEDARWVIEVKVRARGPQLADLDQVAAYGSLSGATLWLVVFGVVPEAVKEIAAQRDILITGSDEWKELKSIIEHGPERQVS